MIPTHLTEHSDLSKSHQLSTQSFGLTAVHMCIIDLHVVDPEGPVREYLKPDVLVRQKKKQTKKVLVKL